MWEIGSELSVMWGFGIRDIGDAGYNLRELV
jgi:hypothetical protein